MQGNNHKGTVLSSVRSLVLHALTRVEHWVRGGSLNTPNERCAHPSDEQGQHQKSQSLGPLTLTCADLSLTFAFLKVACPYNPY